MQMPNWLLSIELAALAVVLFYFRGIAGYSSPFGFAVDFAAVPLVIAFLVSGLEGGMLSSIFFFLASLFLFPLPLALFKFTSILPVIIIPALFSGKQKDSTDFFANSILFFFLSIIFYALSSYSFPLSATFGPQVELSVPAILAIGFAYLSIHLWNDGRPAKLSRSHVAVYALFLALVFKGAISGIANYYFSSPQLFQTDPGSLLVWTSIQAVLEFGLAWLVVFPASHAFSTLSRKK